jgi:hypothetical protein
MNQPRVKRLKRCRFLRHLPIHRRMIREFEFATIFGRNVENRF